MLPCGCEHVCCGICEHAARAGRPRLFTRESAAQWDPPNLTDYRGADKLEARNGDSGEPTMWFWQMTGTRWPAHDKRESRTTFNTATKAWRRLTASQEERSAETAARYDREDARLELEAAEELRVVEEEQRVLEEKCKQEAREQQQQQRRRRAEEAASRVHAARNRVRELPMRPRDASPRIALLAALRGVTGNRLCDWALAAASILPTCLGFWKTGYAVSYGYGGAMLAAGALTLRCSVPALAQAHALALVFYGLRLDLFLLYRELALPEEIHQMKKREASFADRLKRAPVILGCSALYYLMAAPLRISAVAPTSGPAAAALVACSFLGFGIAALGDTIKTYVKAKEGKGYLVTSGPFRYLRHPNYTGELFGWTASALLGALVALSQGASFARSVLPWLIGSAVGWVGILFVLAGEAAAGLEKKQKAKYGGTPKYEEWVQGSWAGPVIAMGGSTDK